MQVKNHINAGNIILLDMVKAELIKGDDDLSLWIKEFDRNLILSHSKKPILNIYAQVLNYVQTLIPDVAKVFNVECRDLFYMMRELSFKF